jgi:hypothetical protein
MSGSLPIDKGIPIPAWTVPKNGRPSGSRTRRPWSIMEVGDSFFQPCEPDRIYRTQGTLSTTASHTAARLGWRFETRIVDGGVRVWRTK